MGELILKLRLLRLLGFDFRGWYEHVWPYEPDELICCGGNMCGCYGATYREQWEYYLEQTKETQ